MGTSIVLWNARMVAVEGGCGGQKCGNFQKFMQECGSMEPPDVRANREYFRECQPSDWNTIIHECANHGNADFFGSFTEDDWMWTDQATIQQCDRETAEKVFRKSSDKMGASLIRGCNWFDGDFLKSAFNTAKKFIEDGGLKQIVSFGKEVGDMIGNLFGSMNKEKKKTCTGECAESFNGVLQACKGNCGKDWSAKIVDDMEEVSEDLETELEKADNTNALQVVQCRRKDPANSRECYKMNNMEADFEKAEATCDKWGPQRVAEFMGQHLLPDDDRFRCAGCSMKVEKIMAKIPQTTWSSFTTWSTEAGKKDPSCHSCHGLVNILGDAFIHDQEIKKKNGPIWAGLDASLGGCNGMCDCRDSNGCSRVEQMKEAVRQIPVESCETFKKDEVQNIGDNALMSTSDDQDNAMMPFYNAAQQQMVANKKAKRAPSSARSSTPWMGLGTVVLMWCLS